MPIDATVGGASANSNVSVADADAYFALTNSATAWNAVTNKDACLVMATRYLETKRYAGTRSESTQALAWPRSGLYTRDNVKIEDDEIPSDVVSATCELALHYSTGETSTDARDLTKMIKVGPITIENDIDNGERSDVEDKINAYLWPYLAGQETGFKLSLG